MFWLIEVYCVIVILKPTIIFLELSGVCQGTKSDLVMYFTVSMVFVNYFDDLID